MSAEPTEITAEQIYDNLEQYQDIGMLEYVLPSEPLGEVWIVGYNQQILKFVTKEGVVGFLAGISVCAAFLAKRTGAGPLTRARPGKAGHTD